MAEKPKATARHDKLAKSKSDEIEAKKHKADTERMALRRMKEERKAEIKKLPRSERSAARKELRKDIAARKREIELAQIEYEEARDAAKEEEKSKRYL